MLLASRDADAESCTHSRGKIVDGEADQYRVGHDSLDGQRRAVPHDGSGERLAGTVNRNGYVHPDGMAQGQRNQ